MSVRNLARIKRHPSAERERKRNPEVRINTQRSKDFTYQKVENSAGAEERKTQRSEENSRERRERGQERRG